MLSNQPTGKSKVASVSWLCPNSVNNTSSIVSSPHLGQNMLCSNCGLSEFSFTVIVPTSQSKMFLHFLHSKLISILPLFGFRNRRPYRAWEKQPGFYHDRVNTQMRSVSSVSFDEKESDQYLSFSLYIRGSYHISR